MVSRCHILVVITTSILTIGLAWAGSSNNSLYTRCAACHLPSGAGVPGIYPPLKGNLNKFFLHPNLVANISRKLSCMV